MSYKNLNDLQYLYEGVVSDSQTDELSEAVICTVINEMIYRGYSESAINQYFGNISEVELIERFLSTFEIENLTLSEQQEEKRALILERPNLGGLIKLLGGGKKITSDTLTREASKRGPGFLKKFQSWMKGSKVTSGADDAASGASKANKDGRSLLDRVLNRNKPDTKKTELQNRMSNAVDKNKDKIGKTNIDTSGNNTAAKVAASSAVAGTTAAVVSNSGNNNQKNNKVTAAPVTDKDKEDAKKEADLESAMKASGKYKEVAAPGKGNEGKTVLQKVKNPDPKDNKLDTTPVKTPAKKPEVKVEKQPEVKTDDYLGKSQGLLGKDDWLKKTRNSPAASSGAFTNDQRWSTQLKHRQWQKDNNRGKFRVKPEKTKSDTYTTKIGAFLNNKKVGDKKGTGNHTITKINPNYESYDAYDLVLNYIMESKQASSIEEANYIMLEMDQNTIYNIVKENTINRADILGGTRAVENARRGIGKYTPGVGVTKDFQLDPNFKIKA